MKVITILDQTQAGLGGDEHANTPLGGKKLALGSAETTAKALEKVGGQVIGTFYCGTQFYEDNSELVREKFTKMAIKMEADVVILGPTYNYPEFSKMACEIAEAFKQNTHISAIQASAIEENQALIDKYKDELLIVKMPKKGDTGLSDAIQHLAEGCKVITQNEDVEAFKTAYCY